MGPDHDFSLTLSSRGHCTEQLWLVITLYYWYYRPYYAVPVCLSVKFCRFVNYNRPWRMKAGRAGRQRQRPESSRKGLKLSAKDARSTVWRVGIVKSNKIKHACLPDLTGISRCFKIFFLPVIHFLQRKCFDDFLLSDLIDLINGTRQEIEKTAGMCTVCDSTSFSSHCHRACTCKYQSYSGCRLHHILFW